jgi:hypothetical protein
MALDVGIHTISARIYHANQMRAFLAAHAGIEGCWIWPHWKDRDGYGRTTFHQKTAIAHRIAYVLTYGPIPLGVYVLHRCDTPPCCNPHHLFLGTQRENCADAKSKDRHTRGERNGSSKLTPTQVIAIRADRRRQIDIAATYNIRQTTVSEIKLRHRWSHLW